MKTDVAIIGGGVVGCAVAYYLAKHGARVTIVERSVVGSGASSANSGAIAMATKKPGLSLDLALASQRLYPGLGAELGIDVDYAVQGNLIVAETETEAIFLEKAASAGQRKVCIGLARADDDKPAGLRDLPQEREAARWSQVVKTARIKA